MPNFTEIAIKDSFMKLLNEKPLSQISVRMIVEDCGINRNTFYYHYQDIPTLIEDIVKSEVGLLFSKYPTIDSLNDSITVVFNYITKNKNAVKHIYNSVNRDIYETYMMKICDYIVKTYLNTVFDKEIIPGRDKDLVIRFFKCEIFGLSFDWIMNGMEDDIVDQMHRITDVCHGLSEDLIKRITENKK